MPHQKVDVREVAEGKQVQGIGETVSWQITTTPVGSSPTSPSVIVLDESAGLADVTSTVASGSASALGDVITCPPISGLTLNHTYRVNVTFAMGGNILVHYFRILAQR